MGLTTVLFDFYDTLAWLEPSILLEARAEAARMAGVGREAFMALWRDSMTARVDGSLGPLERQFQITLSRLDVACPPDLARSLADLDRGAWARAVTLYPDSFQVITGLRKDGYKLGLVSNCSAESGHALQELGVGELFHAMALSYDVGLVKPDPAIFLGACQRLGSQPQECVFVADDAGGELTSAKGLGMLTVLVDRGKMGRERADSQVYDLKVTDLGPLPGWLQHRRKGERPCQ